ncbi:NAD(P)(+) transhydrogenase (Re/Si-specific) subunit alpha [Gordonibacter sp. 28C]|uniref:Re/Si-specific NAD(P)(+) transhydrogenase subunit alpha n=1 Tax=Gordonibacter sp. 28C TaxID=2078569 RepID=UPI000DF78C23|nr:Re/Si-specific NAD(P)(+) transhydrogenase subunit alpha [Gordonibacter sp. 28C]RDB62436.1 NAD(P)(+) transhydrogenase (Re/Si-specific) subunit alpha [Gordonibacter sp. 28C]
MRIGIPKEPFEGQTLVAASPDTVAKLIKLGYEIAVEEGAGARAGYFDDQYLAAGAEIVGKEEAWGSDIVTCLDTPPAEELSLVKKGATLLARMNPGASPELIGRLAVKNVTALALDMVPRLSRAQSLDVRSSMMNVAGNRAVIEAANRFGRLFAGQVTAAGKVPPAKVYVIGVGVAGLAAIGAAGSMGAEVSATDVRAEVADQVESLGGTFVEIPVRQESSDGYAKELAEEQQKAVLEVYKEQAAKSDIVITTAQVPGRPAPLLLTAQAVAGMRPGSVIVDMGASGLGSNCELTRPGEAYTTENGVTIIGYGDLPSRLPGQSSQLFGQNVVNLFKLATPKKDGVPIWDAEDEVIRGMLVTVEGKVMWPPPPAKVSAAQQPAQAAPADEAPEAAEAPAWKKWWWKVALGVLGVALVLTAPTEMAGHFIVFELAVVVGFYVITSVTHTLHTPLMSVTNAISGIIVVGAILLAGSSNPIVAALSFVAMVIASINVFGGFLITNRMLKMFERSSE